MGIVTWFVCIGAGINLAALAVLWRKVDGLPAELLALARRERAQGETRALTALQEMAAARVTSITLSLQSLEQQQIERHRDERAAAEMRARVAERRAMDGVPGMRVAADLVREAHALVDFLQGHATTTEPPAGERVTPLPEHTPSGPRIAVLPPAAEMTTEGGEEGTP